MPSEERFDDRKDQGDNYPDRIGVTGGDPNVDDRKDQGDSDPDRVGQGGDPESGRSQRSR